MKFTRRDFCICLCAFDIIAMVTTAFAAFNLVEITYSNNDPQVNSQEIEIYEQHVISYNDDLYKGMKSSNDVITDDTVTFGFKFNNKEYQKDEKMRNSLFLIELIFGTDNENLYNYVSDLCNTKINFLTITGLFPLDYLDTYQYKIEENTFNVFTVNDALQKIIIRIPFSSSYAIENFYLTRVIDVINETNILFTFDFDLIDEGAKNYSDKFSIDDFSNKNLKINFYCEVIN